MFRGVTQLSLDAKGRLAIPARYRSELMSTCSGHLIVTVDPS
ncbi:MAG: cell division/cell wall cluster transcriptional repressor MraZ, partial [Nitrosomonas sp.]|nr:cell division/cell wall cluster transcriptional repressor MraZ [Nitrosomonas sp.]